MVQQINMIYLPEAYPLGPEQVGARGPSCAEIGGMVIKDLTTVKSQVEHLLDKYPQTRDCDKTLWLGYLVLFRNAKSKLNSSKDPWTELKWIVKNSDTATMESLSRVRRKFQEAGYYVGTKRQEKLEEASAVRDWANQTRY